MKLAILFSDSREILQEERELCRMTIMQCRILWNLHLYWFFITICASGVPLQRAETPSIHQRSSCWTCQAWIKSSWRASGTWNMTTHNAIDFINSNIFITLSWRRKLKDCLKHILGEVPNWTQKIYWWRVYHLSIWNTQGPFLCLYIHGRRWRRWSESTQTDEQWQLGSFST